MQNSSCDNSKVCKIGIGRFMRYLLLSSVAKLGIFVVTLPATPVPDIPGWQLAWHDEFQLRTLDTRKWEALDRRDSFNNEKQYYHPNQVSLDGEFLTITAIDLPREGKAFQSGLITSQGLFGPGRFEARIDLPTSQGMWPAFWLNANHIPWPQGGEIDILENRGSQPALVSSAYHWQTNPGPCCSQHEFVFEEHVALGPGGLVDFHAGFHTYAVEWSADELRYYVDDDLHYVVTETPNRPIFETAKNIIVNLAVGGNFGGDPDATTEWPQSMVVDYARYWKRNDRLLGDYNDDAAINLSDYTVWRDSLGTNGLNLSADGSGNGNVGSSDYELWRSHFAGTSAGLAANPPAVPEPSSFFNILSGLSAAMLKLRGGKQGIEC